MFQISPIGIAAASCEWTLPAPSQQPLCIDLQGTFCELIPVCPLTQALPAAVDHEMLDVRDGAPRKLYDAMPKYEDTRLNKLLKVKFCVAEQWSHGSQLLVSWNISHIHFTERICCWYTLIRLSARKYTLWFQWHKYLCLWLTLQHWLLLWISRQKMLRQKFWVTPRKMTHKSLWDCLKSPRKRFYVQAIQAPMSLIQVTTLQLEMWTQMTGGRSHGECLTKVISFIQEAGPWHQVLSDRWARAVEKAVTSRPWATFNCPDSLPSSVAGSGSASLYVTLLTAVTLMTSKIHREQRLQQSCSFWLENCTWCLTHPLPRSNFKTSVSDLANWCNFTDTSQRLQKERYDDTLRDMAWSFQCRQEELPDELCHQK